MSYKLDHLVHLTQELLDSLDQGDALPPQRERYLEARAKVKAWIKVVQDLEPKRLKQCLICGGYVKNLSPIHDVCYYCHRMSHK